MLRMVGRIKALRAVHLASGLVEEVLGARVSIDKVGRVIDTEAVGAAQPKEVEPDRQDKQIKDV